MAQPVTLNLTLNEEDVVLISLHARSRFLNLSGNAKLNVFGVLLFLCLSGFAFVMPLALDMTTSASAFQVSVVLIALVMLVFYKRYWRWAVGRSSRAYQSLPLLQNHVIDDQGIRSELKDQSSHLGWPAVVRAVETDTHLLLYVAKLRAFVLPKRAIAADDLVRLRALIAEKVADFEKL